MLYDLKITHFFPELEALHLSKETTGSSFAQGNEVVKVTDIVLQILSFLPDRGVGQAALVCRSWLSFAEHTMRGRCPLPVSFPQIVNYCIKRTELVAAFFFIKKGKKRTQSLISDTSVTEKKVTTLSNELLKTCQSTITELDKKENEIFLSLVKANQKDVAISLLYSVLTDPIQDQCHFQAAFRLLTQDAHAQLTTFKLAAHPCFYNDVFFKQCLDQQEGFTNSSTL